MREKIIFRNKKRKKEKTMKKKEKQFVKICKFLPLLLFSSQEGNNDSGI